MMHALAIVLKGQGWEVSGSDDEIYSPSADALARADLLPEKMGWFPSRVDEKVDCVILGMHAKADNPELRRAQALRLPIYSYAQFITKYTTHRERIVITGSHGKTTTTAIIMHILKKLGLSFDYVLGAPMPGFDTTVRLEGAQVIVIEGDEYPDSALNMSPKVLEYAHHIGLITGIAWDHINFFPTQADYFRIFERFIQATPKAGVLVYNKTDKRLKEMVKAHVPEHARAYGYDILSHKVLDGRTHILHKGKKYPLQIFGAHNLMNISGAVRVLQELYVSPEECYASLADFQGVYQRLMPIYSQNSKEGSCHIHRDFAHAPSKVAASVSAMRKQYANKKLAAVLELHTFSSLDERFIPFYKDALNEADCAIVYINTQVLKNRSQGIFTQSYLADKFNKKTLHYVNDTQEILRILKEEEPEAIVLMSSGHFGGMEVEKMHEYL